jgi:hypothetical protein
LQAAKFRSPSRGQFGGRQILSAVDALEESFPDRRFPFCSERIQSHRRLFLQLCNSRAAPWQPRAGVPDVVGSRRPSPYNFRAGIQSFQGVVAQFPGETLRGRVMLTARPSGRPRAGREFQARHKTSAARSPRVPAFAGTTCVSSWTVRFPDLFKQRAVRPRRRAGKRRAGKLAQFLFLRKTILKFPQPRNLPSTRPDDARP